MDTGALIGTSVVAGVFFFVMSQAKDKSGKKYGFKKMGVLWLIAIGILGGYSVMAFTTTPDGSVKERPIPFGGFVMLFGGFAGLFFAFKGISTSLKNAHQYEKNKKAGNSSRK